MAALGITGTKWKIFESAIYLFSKKGYDNVSLREIAEGVGIKQAAIYYYFKKKDDILALIYKYYYDTYISTLTPLEELLKLIGKIHPYAVFRELSVLYNKDFYQLLIRMTQILMKQRDYDSRANEIIVDLFFNIPIKYFRPILKKMIAMNIIEPLDIDTWILVITHFNLLSITRAYSQNPMTDEEWINGRELIYSIIRCK